MGDERACVERKAGGQTIPRGTGLHVSTIETRGGAGSLRFAKGPGFDLCS